MSTDTGMTAEQIMADIMKMLDQHRAATVTDVLTELRSEWSRDEDEDSWDAGFQAAVQVIADNFPHNLEMSENGITLK